MGEPFSTSTSFTTSTCDSDADAPERNLDDIPCRPNLLLLLERLSSSQLVELTLGDSPALLVGGKERAEARFVALDPIRSGVAEIAEAEVDPEGSLDPRDGYPVFAAASSALGESLVLVTPPGSGVRVNGLPTPVITPLALGDQLSLGPGSVYHVSRRFQTTAIPTPPGFVGEQCPLCLAEFAAETRVVVCPACGTPRHLEGEEVPETSERLVCAELGSCPVCDTPPPTTAAGLAFVPDGFDHTEIS